MTNVVTVGVYGFTLETFLEALAGAHVRLVVDVRDRRGVRGTDYAWANAARLQAALADAGIEYEHRRDLATPRALREIQYAADAEQSVGQRSRTELASEVRDRYLAEVLADVALTGLVASFPSEGATALLCVEREPSACHRSLIAERLAADLGASVTHLRPREGA